MDVPRAQAAMVRGALVSAEGRAITASGDIGKIVKHVRKALGMTQCDLAGRSGYSQATISRLEKGGTRVNRDIDVLADITQALHIPPAVLNLPSTSTEIDTDDDMLRRDFLTGVISIGATALLPRRISRLDGPITPQDVQDGWTALRRLYELDDSHGGARIYRLAVDMAQHLDAALQRGTCSTSVVSDLQMLTATAMEHSGWLAFDGGNQGNARRWWLEASHLADVSGIPDARVAALLSMALQASTSLNRGKEAVSLISTARKVAGSSASAMLRSLFSAREAVGHAMIGDSRQARSAISDSREWLERGRDGSEPLWLDFWSEADLACHETRAALATGDSRLAVQSAQAAYCNADRTAFPRNHTIYAVRLGSVLARAGQLEEAVAVTAEAVEFASSVRGSRRIVGDLRATVDILDITSYKPAKDFATATRKVLAGL